VPIVVSGFLTAEPWRRRSAGPRASPAADAVSFRPGRRSKVAGVLGANRAVGACLQHARAIVRRSSGPPRPSRTS
jgi:hypothetical protein